MTTCKQIQSMGVNKIYENGDRNDGQSQILKKIETRKECGCSRPATCARQALHEVYIGQHRQRQSNFEDKWLCILHGRRSTVHVFGAHI